MNAVADGFYIYAITEANGDAPLEAMAIGGGGRVERLRWKDVAAVVSASPIIRYEPLRKNFLAHQWVIEEMMKKSSVLPVRFGTVAPGRENVLGVLRLRHEEFAAELARFRERVEHGVRADWEQEGVAFAEIVAEDAHIRHLRDRLAKLPPEKTWDARRRLGHMVEDALLAKREREVSRMLKRLTPLSAEHRLNSSYGDRWILNAAFLVNRARVDEFDQTVDALSDEYEGRVKFNYVGPVAPFNFIEIVIPLRELTMMATSTATIAKEG